MQSQIWEFIKQLESQKDENKVIYLKNNEFHTAKGNICLKRQLGNYIDVAWDSTKGNMLIKQSNQENTTYFKYETYQVFRGVEFRDANICPYFEKAFMKSQKFYKPCACVLLVRKEDSHILVTRRKLTLSSFPGAWVLPGGHLQKGEGLLEGGLRQAKEQVGLQIKSTQILIDQGVMAWQSAFSVDNKIVSSSFVMFFTARVPKYEVKPQQTQIEEFIWKDSCDLKDEHKYTSLKKSGYGEAHLNYLSFYRLKNYKIQQTKHWIQEEINLKLEVNNGNL